MHQVTNSVFCDSLRVSVPSDDAKAVMADVAPCLDMIGAHVDYQGSYRVGTGLFSCRSTRGVSVFVASGQILAELRARELLGQYLMAFSSVPHTVTRIDATVDLPLYAPDVVRKVYRQGHRELVQLSRKVVSRKHVQQQFGPVCYEPPSARVTGSVYFGGPQAEVRGVVYDKRQEMLQKQGVDIGEDRVRFECRVKSGMKPSLKDAYNPAPLFFHFMAPSLVDPSPSVPPWVPAGSSFHIDRPEVLPYQRMKSIVESSHDLRRIVELAESMGEPGVTLAMGLLRRQFAAQGRLSA